jgi:predicted membrane metal-binding protein
MALRVFFVLRMEDTMDLTPTQVILLGLVAAALAQAYKLIAAKIGKPVDRKVITGVLFVVSVLFGWLWGKPTLPAFPAFGDDPAGFALSGDGGRDTCGG